MLVIVAYGRKVLRQGALLPPCIGELPFELSDPQVGIWKWYYMETYDHDHAGGKILSAAGPGPYLTFKKADAYGSPLMLWAFVGDPATGFKIYNRAHEETFTLSNPYDKYVHNATAGPFLAREGDNPTLWRLIDHSGMSYGWQDMDTRDWPEPMNFDDLTTLSITATDRHLRGGRFM